MPERSAATFGAADAPRCGSSFTSSSGQARTRSTGSLSPRAARSATNRRNPACANGQAMSA
jgi:hypothetical protein